MKQVISANRHPHASSLEITRVKKYAWLKVLSEISKNSTWLLIPFTAFGFYSLYFAFLKNIDTAPLFIIGFILSAILIALVIISVTIKSEATSIINSNEWLDRNSHRPFSKTVHVIFKDGSIKWSQKTRKLNWSKNAPRPIAKFIDATHY